MALASSPVDLLFRILKALLVSRVGLIGNAHKLAIASSYTSNRPQHDAGKLLGK